MRHSVDAAINLVLDWKSEGNNRPRSRLWKRWIDVEKDLEKLGMRN